MAGLLWYRSYMDSLANTSGYYPDIHAGHADRTSELTLTVPYLSRSVPSGYNHLELAQIIGGTMVVEGSLQSVETTAHVTKDANNNIIATYPLANITLRGIPKTVDGILSYDGDTYEPDGTVTRKYGTITVNGTENWIKSNTYPGNYYISQFVSNTSAASPNIVNNYTPNIATSMTQLSNYDRCVMFDGGSAKKNLNIKNSDIASVADFKTWLSANPITLVYKLVTETTESADPFTTVQTVEEGGTVEFVTSNNIPVGNVSIYRRV